METPDFMPDSWPELPPGNKANDLVRAIVACINNSCRENTLTVVEIYGALELAKLSIFYRQIEDMHGWKGQP